MALYDSIDHKYGYGWPGPNAEESQVYVETYLCPSDPEGLELVNYGSGTMYAKTNMAGVADSRNHTCDGT